MGYAIHVIPYIVHEAYNHGVYTLRIVAVGVLLVTYNCYVLLLTRLEPAINYIFPGVSGRGLFDIVGKVSIVLS